VNSTLSSSLLLYKHYFFPARDHGIPQLNNYAQLIIDVTDVNDNIPNILITKVNGTYQDNQPIIFPECTPKGNTKYL
jgi:hypothetical protein